MNQMFGPQLPKRGFQTLWTYITDKGTVHHRREVWMIESMQGEIATHLSEIRRQYPNVVRVVIDIALNP